MHPPLPLAPLPDLATATLAADERHTLDCFSAEVIHRLPAEQRDLLVRTAVLERLSGALCDHVLHRTGSAAVLPI